MITHRNSGWIWVALGGGALLLMGGGTAVASIYSGNSNKSKYLPVAQSAASQYGIPWQLLAAQIQQESAWNPSVISSAGAIGISQFEPSTASSIGVNPYNPYSAIPGMAELMSQYHNQYGSWQEALAAYNAGPEAVDQSLQQQSNYGGYWLDYLPSQTQNYVPKIIANSGLVLT